MLHTRSTIEIPDYPFRSSSLLHSSACFESPFTIDPGPLFDDRLSYFRAAKHSFAGISFSFYMFASLIIDRRDFYRRRKQWARRRRVDLNLKSNVTSFKATNSRIVQCKRSLRMFLRYFYRPFPTVYRVHLHLL